MEGKPVFYREWRRLTDEELEPNQSRHSYGWGSDELPGTFLEFSSYCSNEEMINEALIMRPDGTVIRVNINGFRFSINE